MITRERKRETFVSGVLVLTAANVLVKVAGLVAKIVMNRAVGSVGAGYYSSAYEIYAYLYVLSTSGLPVALSILVSGNEAAGRSRENERLFRVASVLFFTVGALGCVLLSVFAKPIAALIGAPETATCLLAIAPTMVFVCVESVYRGYFQGFGKMGPTAFSQLIEALCKVAVIVFAAYYGASHGLSPSEIAAICVFGVTLGVFLGMLSLAARKAFFSRKVPLSSVGNGEKRIPIRGIVRKLLTLAVPITLSSSVLSLTTVLDTVMIQNRMALTGLTPLTVQTYYGDYTSLVVSLYNLPSILIYPIANTLVPLISAAQAAGEGMRAQRIRELAIRTVGTIALPCAAGLSVFSGPILRLLGFRAESVARAAPWLSVAALSVVFLGVIAVTNAFLNASGHTGAPIVSMLAGAAVKIAVNWFLIPKVGMIGAPIATLSCYVTASVCNVVSVVRRVGRLPPFTKTILPPAIVSCLSVGSALGVYVLLSRVLPEGIATVAAIVYTVLVYASALILSGIFRPEELSVFPFPGKISKYMTKSRQKYK